jgi:hypothetical protein
MTKWPAGQGSSTAWRWTAVGTTLPSGFGMLPTAGVAVTTTGEVAHLLATEADGSRVRHYTVTAGGGVDRRPDLPLRSVSSVVAEGDGIAVAGARTGDDAPVVCRVRPTGEATLVDVPRAFPVAAWPVLARSGTDPAGAAPQDMWVVWAVGRDPAELCSGVLADGGIEDRAPRIPTRIVLDLQVATAPGGIDVLWQSADGVAFRRIGGGGDVPEVPELSGGASLSPGVVLTPRPGHRVAIWNTLTGARGEIVLPAPPEGENSQVMSARTLSASARPLSHLVWWTRTAAEDATGSGGLSATTRGWIAALDPETWSAGPATELPGGSGTVVALHDRLLVVPAGQPLAGWIGDVPGP